MSERVTDPAYWVESNGVDDPEMAELALAVLGSLTDSGILSAHREGGGKVIVGPNSSLLLPTVEAEMAFATLLSRYSEEAR